MSLPQYTDSHENKHITSPSSEGFQVRIVRNKKEYSRYFSHKQWGSKKRALVGARNWRDQMLVSLGKPEKYITEREISPNKETTGVRGVSIQKKYDKRKDASYLNYLVYWRDGNKAKNRTFAVGRIGEVEADQELHAFRTAVRFRQEYELSKAEGCEFYPERFANWKKERVYDKPLELGEDSSGYREGYEKQA